MSSEPLKGSDVTPGSVYMNRRELLKAAGIGLTSIALGGVISHSRATDAMGPTARGADELGNSINPMVQASGFTNYYDVSLDKRQVKHLARYIPTDPWSLTVGGLVHKPKTFSIDDLVKIFGTQQQIRRMRCVEAWSVVLPWDGIPLRDIINYVEPMASGKFLRFESIYDPEHFVGQRNPNYPWPYVEALRMDEAMNELTMMATGMYGQPLPKENGAPIRLVVPWKYGFKSAKAVIKIEVTEEQPVTFWNLANPAAYGFWANVNPEVDHPNWSQAEEFRLGTRTKVPSLMFNGYGAQVAHMYKDMDLRQLF